MKPTNLAIRRNRRSHIDDSPEAIEARMTAFVERTRGWASRAMKSKLPDTAVVLAGPTRKNPRFKPQ